MSKSEIVSKPVERSTPGSVVQVLQCPAEGGRARVMVLPAPVPRAPRSRRHRVVWLLLVPLAFLPWCAAREDDMWPADTVPPADSTAAVAPSAPIVPVVSSGEVEAGPATPSFETWAASLGDGDAIDPAAARREAAEGIRRLAAALDRAGSGARRADDAEALGAMRWHGAQLARVAPGPYAEYAASGHVHAALGHAARLLAALPDVPGGLESELTAAAEAVGPRPLSEQRSAVRSFFRRASAVLASSAAPSGSNLY